MNLEDLRFHLLLPVVRDPHFVRFAEAVQKTGVCLHAHLYIRDGQPPNSEIHQTHQARFSHQRYLTRILPLLRSLLRLRHAFADADVVYAMGFDLTLLARLALLFSSRHPRLIYEVADIRSIQVGKGLVSRGMRALERWVTKRTSRIVVTSQAYGNNYFVGMLGVNPGKIVLLENKLYEESVAPRLGVNESTDKKDTLTIGYFGVLRCLQTWEILKRVAEMGGERVQIRVRGIPDFAIEKVLPQEAKHFPNITVEGRYDPKTDLGTMYNGLDLVFTAADYEQPALIRTWPRTNRFYECCYYRVPLLDNQNSANGDVIEREGIGLTVQMDNPEDAARRIVAVTRAEVEGWRNAIRQLPEEDYLHRDEVQKLIESLLE